MSVNVDYQVHEKLTGHLVNRPSTRTLTKDIVKGESNDELAHALNSESSAAATGWVESLHLTENDSTGTLQLASSGSGLANPNATDGDVHMAASDRW